MKTFVDAFIEVFSFFQIDTALLPEWIYLVFYGFVWWLFYRVVYISIKKGGK